MRKNGTNGEGSDLEQVKAAALEILGQLSSPEFSASDLFPYGVNEVNISVRSGDAEITVNVGGPDHAHPHSHELDLDEWEDIEDEDDEMFSSDNLP